jgi:hypothetical protein
MNKEHKDRLFGGKAKAPQFPKGPCLINLFGVTGGNNVGHNMDGTHTASGTNVCGSTHGPVDNKLALPRPDAGNTRIDNRAAVLRTPREAVLLRPAVQYSLQRKLQRAP